MEEQAVPLQPMGTVWSTSPPAAMEEPTVQQWMCPEGAAAHGYRRRSSPGLELQPVERSLKWGRWAEGAATQRDCLEQCLKHRVGPAVPSRAGAGRAATCGNPVQDSIDQGWKGQIKIIKSWLHKVPPKI